MPSLVRRRREKVSATLAPALVERITQYQREAGLPSFSAALEELLWRQLLEDQSRAYYLSLSEAERREQKAWSKFATKQAGKTLGRG